MVEQDLHQAKLDGLAFKHASIITSEFIKCSFKGANLSGVKFTDSVFISTNLIGAHLENICIDSEKSCMQLLLDNFKLIEASAVDFTIKRSQAMDLFLNLSCLIKNPASLNELLEALTKRRTKGKLTFWQYDDLAQASKMPFVGGLFGAKKNRGNEHWVVIQENLQSRISAEERKVNKAGCEKGG